MKLDDSLWSALGKLLFSRGILELALLTTLLGGCAEGVPTYGTAAEAMQPVVAPAGNGGTGMSGVEASGAGGMAGSSGSGAGTGGAGRAGSSASAGSSGSSGIGGAGSSGDSGVACDVASCPEPPPPFPFTPAPAACCKTNGQCGAVDLFGGCA